MMGSFKGCKKFYTHIIASIYFVAVCLFSVSLYAEDSAACKVEPNGGILGDTADFIGGVFEGTAEVAGGLFLGDEYSKDNKLGEGDTIFDWAYIFGIAALANYRTLGNLIFMLSYNSALNDSSDLAQDVIRGKVSQKKLDKRQKSLAKAEGLYLPIWNANEVKWILDSLIYKGLPAVTGFSIPKPPLETYYNVEGGDQYIGVMNNPAIKENDKDKKGQDFPQRSQ